MSDSALTTYVNISPNRSRPRNHQIDTITIHCMAGQMSVESCGNLFARSTTQASSNYGIGPDGRIGLYVPESDRSWASSNAANDNRAVTIEVASDATHPYKVTDAAYKALVSLCADICRRNGIKALAWSADKNVRVNHLGGANMTVHRDFANKACPGDYLYNLHPQIAAEVNAILSGSGEKEAEPKKQIWEEVKMPKLTKGMSGSAVRVWQAIIGYEVTGKFDKATQEATLKWKKKHGLDDKPAVGDIAWRIGLDGVRAK